MKAVLFILFGGLLVFISGVLIGALLVNSVLTPTMVKSIYTPIAHKALLGYPIMGLLFGIGFLSIGFMAGGNNK